MNLLNILFKPSCIICKSEIDESNNLCYECWHKIDFISELLCDICGSQLEYEGAKCLICREGRFSFDKIRAAVKLGEYSEKIVYQLQHNDKIHLARKIAKLMMHNIKDLLSEIDIICALPIDKTTLYKRRYNQAQLLSYYIAKYSDNLSILDNRIIVKQSNYKKDIKRGAFNVKKADILQDKNILIVNDVMTTGQTLSECAFALKMAGGSNVYVVLFAKA